MSLDLYQDEADQALDRLPKAPTTSLEAPFFHNFLPGTMRVMASEMAKVGRSVSMAASVPMILADAAMGGTELQDRFFQQHDEVFGSAVKYWTPQPGEVGFAGEVVGSLAGMLPTIIANPALAVGSQVMSQGEDLVEKGVSPAKAVGVGVVQGAGLATGIWMPILGQNLWQRVVLGGAGFNVLQGVTTRAGSQLILEGEKAAEMFPTFDAKMLTLDLLLGMAFGGVAHVSPEMRAQGKDVWARIANWAENLTPEQVDALAAVRQAEHMNAETAPGVLRTPADVEANVNRVKSALESLLRDEAPQVDAMPKPSLEPDRARQVDAETRVGELRADVPRVAAEEGIPELQAAAEPVVRGMPEGWVEMAKLPAEEQPAAIGGAIERRLVELGVQADEAAANGAIWRAFFDTASRKYGVQAAELMRDYGIDLQRMRAVVPGADAALATGGATGYGGGRGRLEQTAGTRPEPEVLQRTVAGGSPEPGWIGATRISRAGRPLPFYRGSELELRPEHFDAGALGVASGNPSSGLGVWFTNTRSEAATYGKVQEAYLDIRNPLVVKIEDLRGFGSVAEAHAWREAQRAKGYDGLVITAKHLGGKTHVVAFDAKQVVPIGGHGEYAQGVKPGPMFYSELARQIQTLPEARVPAEGLTAAEWKALLIEPESRRTVAIRDEKNRPTGKTREVVSPEKVRLPGVVMDEIKWSGLQEWLELQGSEAARAKGWATARFDPKREGGDLGTIVNGEGKMLLGIISRADAERTIREQQALSSGKITRQQVSDFLEQNGVRVDEVMLGGGQQRTLMDATIAEDLRVLRDAGWDMTNDPENPHYWVAIDRDGNIEDVADMRRYAKKDPSLKPIADAAQRIVVYLSGGDATNNAPPKYGQYQLPGAKEGSYRELLLTLPERPQNFEMPAGWRVERMSTAAADAKLDAMVREWREWRTARDIPDVSADEIPRAVWDRLSEDEQRYTYEFRDRWETEQGKAAGGWTLIGPDGTGNILKNVPGTATIAAANKAAREFLESKWLMAGGGRKPAFSSNHWNEDNILAHVRFNERTDADGKRVLFVEEIQSDWAQQGKRRGFTEPGVVLEVKEIRQRPDGKWEAEMSDGRISNEYQTRAEAERWTNNWVGRQRADTVPAAPFVQKTEAWVGLVLKRMIRYAAENGFDSVAWTRGEQQVDRYTGALRKAVDVIEWKKTPDGVQLVGYKGKPVKVEWSEVDEYRGEPVYASNDLRYHVSHNPGFPWKWDGPGGTGNGGFATADEAMKSAAEHAAQGKVSKVVDTTEKETALSDAIGKSMAERIINDPAQSGTIEGENIRVDDTGMASFYDRIVPNVANQLLKKLGGGKVRELGIDVPAVKKENVDIGAEITRREAPEFRRDDGMEEAFQGAEHFTGGGDGRPYFGEVKILVDGQPSEAIVSVDANGVHIITLDAANEFLIPKSFYEDSGYIWEHAEHAKDAVQASWTGAAPWAAIEHIVGDAEVGPYKAALDTPQRSTQQGFDLTPQMRERAMGGQTYFQRNARTSNPPSVDPAAIQVAVDAANGRALENARDDARAELFEELHLRGTIEGKEPPYSDLPMEDGELTDAGMALAYERARAMIEAAVAERVRRLNTIEDISLHGDIGQAMDAVRGALEELGIHYEVRGSASTESRYLYIGAAREDAAALKIRFSGHERQSRETADWNWYVGQTDPDLLRGAITAAARHAGKIDDVLSQMNRGQITFRDGSTVIGLFEGANASTFVHESGHLFLQITRDLALRADAPAAAVADWARLEQWLGIEGGEINTAAHEQFARGWEKYLAEGEAPTPELRTVFQQFRDWLLQVYRTLTELDVKLTDEIRGVMDRMLASEAADPSPARARATTEAEGAPAPTGRAVPPPPRVEAGEARATPEAPDEPDPWLAVADAKQGAEPAPQLGLENDDVRAILVVMAETEAGWAEIGGRHLGGEMGQPNFSSWVPRADWWPQREGKLNEAQTKEAVRKALAGEKLKKKEQLAIDYMVKIAAERATDVGMVGKDEWDLTAEAVHAEDLEPTTRNVVDAALVGRAMEISEGAVERLAVMYEADDAGFMAAVRRMIDAHHEESRRIRQDLEAARSRQEAGSGQPGPAGAGPEGAAAPAAGAGRAAGGDTGRPAGEPQGPAAVEGEAAQPDPMRQAAEDFVATNPGRHIMVGTNEDGTPRYVTAEEYLAEARAQAELARQDVGLFEVAARCMLGGS